MAFEIIPEQFYLNVGADNYLDPTWFNSIFNNINTHSTANGRFTRPVQVMSSTTQIIWKESPTGDFVGIYPDTLVFKEIGSDFAPDGWTATYVWTLVEDPASLYTFVAGSVETDQEISLEIDTSNYDLNGGDHANLLGAMASFTLSCQVTYTDLNGFTLVSTATFGIPLLQLSDGEPAVMFPKSLIWIDSQHKPLSQPGGSATFSVEDASYYPPDSEADQSIEWSLSSGGAPKNNYISDGGDGTAIITIPEVGKTFQLTLEVSVAGIGSSTKTIDLTTYDYGSFLFSSWGTSTPVDAPVAVTVSGRNSLVKSTEQLFPGNYGNITVNWGQEIGEVSRWNAQITDRTNDVFCISGLSDNASYQDAVRSIMSEYGISATESVENYSLVQIGMSDVNKDGAINALDINTGASLVGQSFWATNMRSSSKILYKTIGDSLSIDGNPLINNAYNSLYLVQGVVPSGAQTKISIGPGAERYYIVLQSYSLDSTSGSYNLSGAYDQYAVVSQTAEASPVSMSFNGIPLNEAFKAYVVSANGSAYSLARYSDSLYTLSSSTIASQVIESVVAAPSQYGVSLVINTDSSFEEPVGYMISYKEISSGVSWPAGGHIGTKSSDITVSSIYSVGSKINIAATVGQTVVATARAVMSDGSIGNPVTITPVNVSVPWSYMESGLSKGLGRFNYTVQAHPLGNGLFEHVSLVNPAVTQSNLFTTTFGRDIFIETLIVRIYQCNLATGSAPYTIRLQADSMADSNDEKIVEIAKDTENDSEGEYLTPGIIPVGTIREYIIADLSIPISANSNVVVALQGAGIADTIDIEAEIHYSNAAIITSTTPT